jgi:hypothetical protein
MKVNELIVQLQALAACGLGEAPVEAAFITMRGTVAHGVVTTAERNTNGHADSVLLRALKHRELFEVEA